MKNIRFLSENFQFLEVKLSIYLNMRVFVMNHPKFAFTFILEKCVYQKIGLHIAFKDVRIGVTFELNTLVFSFR